MKKATLIADGGGTKVDWCLIEESGELIFFQTESYHPHLINEDFIKDRTSFWKNYTDKYDLELYFYGAGCSSSSNQELLRSAFTVWGMNVIEVRSDLVAASIATLGNENGFVGILGTGSVLAKISQSEPVEIFGGFGYLLGDEGSGYYFGKLVLRNLLIGKFSKDLSTSIYDILGSRTKIMSKVYGAQGKSFVSSIAYLLRGIKSKEIDQLHKENIELFVNLYVLQNEINSPIHFIGSYAKNFEEILSEILRKNGLDIGKVIEKPIGELANYFVRTAF